MPVFKNRFLCHLERNVHNWYPSDKKTHQKHCRRKFFNLFVSFSLGAERQMLKFKISLSIYFMKSNYSDKGGFPHKKATLQSSCTEMFFAYRSSDHCLLLCVVGKLLVVCGPNLSHILWYLSIYHILLINNRMMLMSRIRHSWHNL